MVFDGGGGRPGPRRIPGCAPAALGFRLEAAAASAAHGTRLPVAEGFELDLAGRVLRHGSEPVHLRPIEFRLLAALAGAPGRAFTRRQLLDSAWPSRPPVDLRTVDVHVHWLRSKIEREPSRPTYLVTVRGYGYRLDPPGPLTIP
jgi:two-component system response regulator MtrA